MASHQPGDYDLAQADKQRGSDARQAAKQEASDAAWLMSGPRGRRIVWRTLERCGVFRNHLSNDLFDLGFHAGLRNEGLRLLANVQGLPEFAVMLNEHAPKPDLQPTENDA